MLFSVKSFCQTAVLCTAVLACGFYSSTASAQSNDMRAVMNRLDQMDNQIQTLSQSVFQGGGVQTAAPVVSYDGSMSEGGNIAAMLNSRLTEIEEEMRALNGRVEEQNFTINQIKNQMDLMKGDIELRLNMLESGGNSMTAPAPVVAPQPQPVITIPSQQNTSSINTTLPTNDMASTGYNDYQEANNTTAPVANNIGTFSFDNPSMLYDQAFQAIRDQDFPRAEQGFKEFLGRYSGHSLAGNAKYWLGETYYVRGSFDQAIQTFAEGYQQYPQGNKAPDNLLKLGVTLAQEGRPTDACVSFKQLKSEFPSAAPAIKTRVNKEIERLNCE